MQSLLEQFRDFYHNYDHGQGTKLTDAELDRYHGHMLFNDRLIYESNNDRLLGYIETWRVSPEQIGRIICTSRFDIFSEELSTGSVCYVANITLHPDHRRQGLLRLLKTRLLEKESTAEFFCGQASHGRAKSFKIFTKKDYWTNKRNEVTQSVFQQG